MSECVVRMEMPKRCWTCKCRRIEFDIDYAGVFCSLKGNKYVEDPDSRPSWCPIICSLPEEHGRLIDWDAFERIGFKLCRKTSEWIAELGTPTNESYIVPAERREV